MLLLSSLTMAGCFNVVPCENCVIRRPHREIAEWERSKIRAAERYRWRQLEQQHHKLVGRHEYRKDEKRRWMQQRAQAGSENRNRQRQ
ncbi:MAG: hypothetical protein ACREX3_21640 [Gammaproteobacteria bacterium]